MKNLKSKILKRKIEIGNQLQNVSPEFLEKRKNEFIEKMESLDFIMNNVNKRTKKLNKYWEIEMRAFARVLGLREFYFFTKKHYELIQYI